MESGEEEHGARKGVLGDAARRADAGARSDKDFPEFAFATAGGNA